MWCLLATLALLPGRALCQSLCDYASSLDARRLAVALGDAEDVDVRDARGQTAFFIAIDAALQKPDIDAEGLEVVRLLFVNGADGDLEQVQAKLRLTTNQAVARKIRAALSDKAVLKQRALALADLRIRRELNISRENMARVRGNLDLLRRSGRFQDYYVAYAVSRSVTDAKHAQALAVSADEKRALEHMALLTVPDPYDVISPSLAVDSGQAATLSIPGTTLLDFQRISTTRDIPLFVRIRQPADAAVRLSHGSYRIHLLIDLRFYASLDAAQKVPGSFVPVSLPLALTIGPPGYSAVEELRLSQLRGPISERLRPFGQPAILSEKIDLQVSRIERLQ
ncbi:MAG TPA: hypothetical protein VF816_18490 [Rhodocyclaceae bacterium]